ncbi:441_t:CDS:2 [Racocetra fulgida]|uniref:441_t:CDS:1 n=1 Tax=Racocetra fulgida TaxID=60492 RepID=A0A9N9I1V3_9GLOM|nr:441_t:CDS:2 [Racocetra fulgida]
MDKTDELTTLREEINRLNFIRDEQFRLRKYFTDNVEKIKVAVAFLFDFTTDDEKRDYLKSLISTHAEEELRAQLEAFKLGRELGYASTQPLTTHLPPGEAHFNRIYF